MWHRLASDYSFLAFQVLGIWVLDATPGLKMNFLEVIVESGSDQETTFSDTLCTAQLLFLLQGHNPIVLALRSHRDRMDESQELFCWIWGHFFLGLHWCLWPH